MQHVEQTAIQPFKLQPPVLAWLNRALFDLDCPLGRLVNISSMMLIVFSVALSMISTLDTITEEQQLYIESIELIATVIFGIEYLLRLLSARKPLQYAFSFYGLIDLLTWLPLLFFGDVTLAIRLLRIMRLLKLIRYLRALHLFMSSIQDVVDSLLVVVCGICVVILVTGNLIHLVEPQNFPNAFIGSWWALVTMTTVGYGDLVPTTGLGKFIAACLMMTGITMFAMLTATISVKISSVFKNETTPKAQQDFTIGQCVCMSCGGSEFKWVTKPCQQCQQALEPNDNYCSGCGAGKS
jgi:voltage-gated potassium channel